MQGLEVHEAASVGDRDALEDYVSSGKFDLNIKDPEFKNKTPLHWACSKGMVLHWSTPNLLLNIF